MADDSPIQKEIDDSQIGQSRQGLNYQQVRALRIAHPNRTEQDRIAYTIANVRAVARETNDYLQGLPVDESDNDGCAAHWPGKGGHGEQEKLT